MVSSEMAKDFLAAIFGFDKPFQDKFSFLNCFIFRFDYNDRKLSGTDGLARKPGIMNLSLELES